MYFFLLYLFAFKFTKKKKSHLSITINQNLSNAVFLSADGRVRERRSAESPVFGSAAERRWESEEVPNRELNVSSQSCGERRRGKRESHTKYVNDL